MAVVYHWKHGWIPLDHTAALAKAKGNHAAAAKMLSDAHDGQHGFHSRQDVAKGALDLPNVPASDRAEAHAKLREGATHHSASDLLPSHAGSMTRSSQDSEHQFQMNNPKSKDWAAQHKAQREAEYASLSGEQLNAAIARAEASGSAELAATLRREWMRRHNSKR